MEFQVAKPGGPGEEGPSIARGAFRKNSPWAGTAVPCTESRWE